MPNVPPLASASAVSPRGRGIIYVGQPASAVEAVQEEIPIRNSTKPIEKLVSTPVSFSSCNPLVRHPSESKESLHESPKSHREPSTVPGVPAEVTSSDLAGV
jgi:hypothetical protein